MSSLSDIKMIFALIFWDIMVCAKCEKRETKQSTHSNWKEDKPKSLSSAVKKGEYSKANKLLGSWKAKYDVKQSRCLICKSKTENNKKYCHQCAYSKGICEYCGVKVLDTKTYKQSDLDRSYLWRKRQVEEEKNKIKRKYKE